MPEKKTKLELTIAMTTKPFNGNNGEELARILRLHADAVDGKKLKAGVDLTVRDSDKNYIGAFRVLNV